MFLLVLLLFIGLCVEIFRYVKIKANAFSEKEVKAAAELQAKRMRIEDPEISCDYLIPSIANLTFCSSVIVFLRYVK